MASINMIDKGERGSSSTKTTKTPTVTKPTTTTKTTTRTEKDEDINGHGMNTQIKTTVTVATDTTGNKTTKTEIIDTPVNNKGVPTTPINTKTTIIKKETVDNPTPTITAVTEKVSKEKTDDGFITHTQTTVTDVPTQESKTTYTSSTNFTTKEKTDEGFITNNTTITRDDTTGAIVADKTNTVSTTEDKISSVEKTDDGFIRTDTTLTRNADTGAVIDAHSVTTTPKPQPSKTPKPSEKPKSFWDQFSDAMNSPELAGLGQSGLGGGNAPVVTPPMSVLTSDNPQDLVDFYKGVGYSMGAGAVAAGTVLVGGAVIPQIVTLAGAGGTGVTATSLAQATAAYGGATLATLPAAAQATLAYGGSALMLGGTAYATHECVKSNDPGSAACVGLVTGYQADPAGFNQALSDSADTLANGAMAATSSLKNSLSSKLSLNQQTVVAQLDGNSPNEIYQGYLDMYGSPPKTIDTIKNPNDLYDFQQQAISLAQDSNTSSQDIVSLIKQVQKDNPNLSIKILSPQAMQNKFGNGFTANCELVQCNTGFLGLQTQRSANIYVSTPSEYANMFGLSSEEGTQMMLQNLAHEGGHGQDWVQLGLGMGTANWATEFRQQTLNVIFNEAIGNAQEAYSSQQLLNLIQGSSNVVYHP